MVFSFVELSLFVVTCAERRGQSARFGFHCRTFACFSRRISLTFRHHLDFCGQKIAFVQAGKQIL
ncbi:hypothetical protein DCC62_19645 [candidate division KSB1 bacterium]|nr:MAG: hypothetical protein DCC62_19645 [candidate division KSB1 bacterium]